MSEKKNDLSNLHIGEDEAEAVFSSGPQQAHDPQSKESEDPGEAVQDSESRRQLDQDAPAQEAQGEEFPNRESQIQRSRAEDDPNLEGLDLDQAPLAGDVASKEVQTQGSMEPVLVTETALQEKALPTWRTDRSSPEEHQVSKQRLPGQITHENLEYEDVEASQRNSPIRSSPTRRDSTSEQNSNDFEQYVEEEIIIHPPHPDFSGFEVRDPSPLRRKPSDLEGSGQDEMIASWPRSNERNDPVGRTMEFDMPMPPTTALTRTGGNTIDDDQPLSLILDFAGVKGLALEAPFIWRQPVDELLEGGRGPAKIMQAAKVQEGRSIVEPVLRWIHLPANNMSWVKVISTGIFQAPLSYVEKSLVQIICQEKLGSDDRAERLKESILRPDYWTASQHGRGSKHFHSRFMKPTCFVNYVGK